MIRRLKIFFLGPCALVYSAAVGLRNFFYTVLPMLSKNPGKLAISIGGIHAGGTGKTPMALLVGQYLSAQNFTVAFLSRGYKRKLGKPVISEPLTMDSWETVGDEPALLHQALPKSWLGIGSNRYQNARKLAYVLGEKSVFILDDGFQHRQLKRSMDIVCLPPNPFIDFALPLGMLREPLTSLNRSNCLCLIGTIEDLPTLSNSKNKLQVLFPDVPVFILYQEAIGWVQLKTGETRDKPSISNPLALCAIARPERFFILLKKMGILPVAQSIFIDHHPFTVNEIEPMLRTYNTKGIVTTEKDAFRLKSLNLADHADIWYLKIGLHFQNKQYQESFYRVINTIVGL